ncbi:SpoIIE family protein phosphatase [Terriglobus albidus]|uniref:SpoIIE family protein phosphatase n=1 Tax=Terriglobus albidus TaxID=1592106 RepID=UPI0021DFCC59|nr:SpoIIE family protein phosphatase [Terriglobus albidus]
MTIAESTFVPMKMLLEDRGNRVPRTLDHVPFTIGRLTDRSLVLDHPFISRSHAQINFIDGQYFLEDLRSTHGTYLNGRRLDPMAGPQALNAGDKLRFGSSDGPLLRFGKPNRDIASLKDLMGQMQSIAMPSEGSDLEKLRWFLEAARKLNAVGAVQEVLQSLVEITLDLTQMERGYVYLRDTATGEMSMAVGLTLAGEKLADDRGVAQSAIQQATRTAAEYIVTDTLSLDGGLSDSMVAGSIRTVICIPLRSRHGDFGSDEDSKPEFGGEILGVLYLDSRLKAGTLNEVDSGLLETIAGEAASLIENASLARAEEAARRYREELNIAAQIQQGLMTVQIPDIPYARINARNVPCKDVGGDFFDVVVDEDGVSLVITDVSGKGVSAALLASTLQGLVYSQLAARQPLEQVARMCNRFICAKDIGKYATMIVLKLTKSGNLQYINCGHVMPLLVGDGAVEKLTATNLPVGLLPDAEYETAYLKMPQNSRLILVTDGVTEAENPEGEFFGDDRLEGAASQFESMTEMFDSVQRFMNGAPPTDDCTMIELRYHDRRGETRS